MAVCARCSTARRRRAGPSEPVPKRSAPPLARASKREHLPCSSESLSRSFAPYTHHTTKYTYSQQPKRANASQGALKQPFWSKSAFQQFRRSGFLRGPGDASVRQFFIARSEDILSTKKSFPSGLGGEFSHCNGFLDRRFIYHTDIYNVE